MEKFIWGGVKKNMKLKYTDEAEEFKQRQLRAIRRKAIMESLLFYILCVIALIIISAVYYLYNLLFLFNY